MTVHGCAFLIARFLLRDAIQDKFGDKLKSINRGIETIAVDMNDLPLPDFSQMRPNDSLQWLNNVCRELVEKWFFEDGQDICEEIRSVLENPQPEENYWTCTLENGRFKCHHCEKDYKRVSSLKAHESGSHDISLSQAKKKSKCSSDE